MEQEGAAVDVTEKKLSKATVFSDRTASAAILAAALTMPCLTEVRAETVPEFGSLSYKYLDYKETQPGQDRIGVRAHAYNLLLPIAGKWSLQAGFTRDVVSGASPKYWTKGAASMNDIREAKDASITRYFEDDTLTVGANLSEEHDYVSRGYSVSGTHTTEDRNTTFNYGLAITHDDITSSGLNKTKNRVDWALGVTQVVTQKDLVQLMLTDVRGKGYFSDPWKIFDERPDSRHQNTILLRWNHYVSGLDATLRYSYRYYTDSWSVKAHTFGFEYVQPVFDGWVITPSMRLHDQSKASFFVSQADLPYTGSLHSLDQRLSAFGARTYGVKVSKTFDSVWTIDVKYEEYVQRSDWRFMGSGSPGIDPFNAKILQLGISKRF